MSVQRGKLQLAGITALFIAAKYEEIFPPSAADFVYITDNTYTADQACDPQTLTADTTASSYGTVDAQDSQV